MQSQKDNADKQAAIWFSAKVGPLLLTNSYDVRECGCAIVVGLEYDRQTMTPVDKDPRLVMIWCRIHSEPMNRAHKRYFEKDHGERPALDVAVELLNDEINKTVN